MLPAASALSVVSVRAVGSEAVAVRIVTWEFGAKPVAASGSVSAPGRPMLRTQGIVVEIVAARASAAAPAAIANAAPHVAARSRREWRMQARILVTDATIQRRLSVV